MNARGILLFDLDGPILDVRLKYYRVYSDVLAEFGVSPIDAGSYWALKRAKVPDADILCRSLASGMLESYRARRESIIETEGYLDVDELQPGALAVLARLEERFDLVLVTMRESEKGVHRQLKRFGIEGLFKAVLCSGSSGEKNGKGEQKWEIKRAMISRYLRQQGVERGSLRAMVGDTETDVRCAHAMGCKAVAVECGIRSRELLALEWPDVIIPGVGLLESCL